MDYYKALGLNRSATKEEIKEAFRKLALKFHPDKHSQSSKPIRDGATLRFKQVSEAYEVLIDDRKRADYNVRCRSGGGAGVSSSSSSSGSGGGYSYYGYYGGDEYGYNRSRYRSDIRQQGNKWRGFDLDVAFRFITSKRFLLNLALASVLLGGAVVIETSGETLWKMHNSGKSFEEAMESIEKTKTQKDKRWELQKLIENGRIIIRYTLFKLRKISCDRNAAADFLAKHGARNKGTGKLLDTPQMNLWLL